MSKSVVTIEDNLPVMKRKVHALVGLFSIPMTASIWLATTAVLSGEADFRILFLPIGLGLYITFFMLHFPRQLIIAVFKDGIDISYDTYY